MREICDNGEIGDKYVEKDNEESDNLKFHCILHKCIELCLICVIAFIMILKIFCLSEHMLTVFD